MPKFPPTLPITALLTRIATVTLGVALFFEQAGARHLLHLDDAAPSLMLTPPYWVSLLAPTFYLAGLWAASDVFVRLDRGDGFGPAMIKGLLHIGLSLMLGGFAEIVVQPSLIFLFSNNFQQMRGVRFNLSVETLTLVLVGVVLILLARQGQALRSKLDQFI